MSLKTTWRSRRNECRIDFMFIVNADIQIPLNEFEWSFVRSSGPGGQNVNKVSSKAQLRWNPSLGDHLSADVLARLSAAHPSCWTKDGEIVVMSQRTRDALKNREDCLEKLKTMILAAIKVPKRRIPTRPTKGSIKRRLDDKNRNAQKKRDRQNLD